MTTTTTTTTTTSTRTTTALLVWICWSFFLLRESHAFTSSGRHSPIRNPFGVMKQQCKTRRPVSLIIIDAGNSTDEPEFEEEDEDDEPEPEDPYLQVAASEFQDKAAAAAKKAPPGISSLMTTSSAASSTPRTTIDWGGALGKLRQRMEDVETGKSKNPSQVLFRLMSSQTPNQAIGSFVSSANPDVVQAMSGAVSALLGGLSNPAMGIETIVKASGEKIGSLCFQLQMTGYMFRNAEYVMALRNLMNIKGAATWQDYKDAFDRLDKDGSGYIEASEVQDLLDDVYKGKADGVTPAFEIKAFLKFFDENKDGKISWDEFERGLGAAIERVQQQQQQKQKQPPNAISKQPPNRLLPEQKNQQDDDDDDDEEDEEPLDLQADVSGKIEIEVKDGLFVEVEAKEYIQSLKAEAEALKKALLQETMGGKGVSPTVAKIMPPTPPQQESEAYGGIANYIASRRGDVKALTEGISPEVVETMKMLVDFVLEGGDSNKKNGKASKAAEMEMELPGSALQQLALWQLVLGYRLREAEATGDYLKLLE